jgi:Ca-activated chloride channel family protein
MTTRFATLLRSTLLAGFALLLTVPAQAERPHRDDDEEDMPAPAAMPMRMKMEFAADAVMGELGATPGGAQDISFFRDRVDAGEVPHPAVFTPEGLFSEHDLPLSSEGVRCDQLLCVRAEATDARLLVQPDVRYVAQVGFSSGLDPATFRRLPLNVVAVVDKSGSMGGRPIEMAKAALHELTKQLGKDDQIEIVLYGDRTHVHLAPTRGDAHDRIARAIDAIQIEGSTYMEAGLKLGYAEARKSAKAFDGLTRVMLFTDERPNVGATDAESFMGMAEASSLAGVGMTTIGVGVQFGAELATKIASVRGGNLFFFGDEDGIRKVFGEELDTIVTELAYDMVLEVRAAPGLKVAGLYGIPGEMVEWTPDGGLRVGIATLFASKRKGAIYAAFASDAGAGRPETRISTGDPVGEVALAYALRTGKIENSTLSLTTVDRTASSAGLSRGALLIDQATALKEATRLHHEKNDQEGAYQLVHAIAALYRQVDDEDLANERELVEKLEHTLARLSGHEGEPGSGPGHRPGRGDKDPVTGLPTR